MDPPDLELPDAFAAGLDPSEEPISAAGRAARRRRRGWPGSGRSSLNWRTTPRNAGRRSRASRRSTASPRLDHRGAGGAIASGRESGRCSDSSARVRDPADGPRPRGAEQRRCVEQLGRPRCVAGQDRRPSTSDRRRAVVPSGRTRGATSRSSPTPRPAGSSGRWSPRSTARGVGPIVVSVRQTGPSPDRRIPVRRPAGDPRRRRRGRAGTPGRPAAWSMSGSSRPRATVPRRAGAGACGCSRGSLMLSGPRSRDRVRAWLEATLGAGTLRRPDRPCTLPGLEPDRHRRRGITGPGRGVLDACPSWLDRSALTFELAEEITLREGRRPPDPRPRRRGLPLPVRTPAHPPPGTVPRGCCFWMAWVWHASGRVELARSAFALACQLSDEQYAVPSHPFTVALSTRSLQAAQAALSGPRRRPPITGRVTSSAARRSAGRRDTAARNEPDPGARLSSDRRATRVRARSIRHGDRYFFVDFAAPLASSLRGGFLAGFGLLLVGLLLLGGVACVAHCSILLVNVDRVSETRNEHVVSLRKKNDDS